MVGLLFTFFFAVKGCPVVIGRVDHPTISLLLAVIVIMGFTPQFSDHVS